MTLLPNGCAIYAVCASTLLYDHGVRCRLVSVKLSQDRHVLCLFMLNGRLRAYDNNGTRTLGRGITLDSHPKVIAKSWLNIVVFKKNWPKKIEAHWY